MDVNGVFRVSPDGELSLVISEQEGPNGIAFSPDEKTMYINDSLERKIYAYDVESDGSVSNGKLLLDASTSDEVGVPDGLKVDNNGIIFTTGPGGVWVIDPSGDVLGRIKPAEVPANVAWGDADWSTL